MGEILDPKKKIEVDGVVIENLPGTKFRVEVEIKGEKHEILGHLSGKMRMNYIKLNVGDTVKVEIPLYDPSKGRIVYRY
ncbi:translation initiation factor IF-1 [Candidatus Dojkabacteria bacterium]|nr:translation initiation factor IF-1 [Candidatus Dojkabacteria bacterium]